MGWVCSIIYCYFVFGYMLCRESHDRAITRPKTSGTTIDQRQHDQHPAVRSLDSAAHAFEALFPLAGYTFWAFGGWRDPKRNAKAKGAERLTGCVRYRTGYW